MEMLKISPYSFTLFLFSLVAKAQKNEDSYEEALTTRKILASAELTSSELDDELKLNTNISKVAKANNLIFQQILNYKWDYVTELVFIIVVAVLAIPNIFLLMFYSKKVTRYKQLRHLNARYARIANSFHTYMIEICCFDTVIVSYLVINTVLQTLHAKELSEYESVYDISNFACKFFIYIVRISAAMSNYLVFLLSLNRCFLVIFRYKPMQLSSHRLCFNTKYLTLFLFCICTIANVFRLELLNISNINNNETIPSDKFNAQEVEELLAMMKQFKDENSKNKGPECAPTFSNMDDSTFLSSTIVAYNILFSIAPSVGNLLISIFIIIKRRKYKQKLNLLLYYCYQAKSRKGTGTSTGLASNCNKVAANNFNNSFDLQSNARSQTIIVKNTEINEIIKLKEVNGPTATTGEKTATMNTNVLNINNDMHIGIEKFKLNEFHAEFLKTCTPCIAFSLTHALLFLPYSLIELVQHYQPSFHIMETMQYINYMRYMFYCCKFYLLFFVSYKFRCEVGRFFTFKKKEEAKCYTKAQKKEAVTKK